FANGGQVVSWAKDGRGVKESGGKKKGNNSTGHGNPYLARILGNAAAAAGRTDTFLGERYRRIARRRGAKKANVAIGRSILVIIWHLLSDPDARFHDLGPGHYASRIDPDRRRHNHVRPLEALGYAGTLQRTACPAPPRTRLRCAPPGAAARPLTHRFSDQLVMRVRFPSPAPTKNGRSNRYH